MQVSTGWLSGKAADWFQQATGALPVGYREVGKEPVVQILDTEAGKIGVVLFPEGARPGSGADLQTEQKVLEAGKSLRGKVRLIVGVSPWGYRAERDFIRKWGNVFGCILGGGEGIGFDFSLKEHPGVLWLRPDSQGRAINIVEFLELPALDSAPKWKENTTFRAYLQFLDEDYPSDQAMIRIIGQPTD